jgi:hypothetical protein
MALNPSAPPPSAPARGIGGNTGIRGSVRRASGFVQILIALSVRWSSAITLFGNQCGWLTNVIVNSGLSPAGLPNSSV